MVATDMIIPRGHRIRPVDVAAMLACGVRSVRVRRKPRAAIIPTGEEIVSPEAELRPEELFGKVIDANSYMLSGMLEDVDVEGAALVRCGPRRVRVLAGELELLWWEGGHHAAGT